MNLLPVVISLLLLTGYGYVVYYYSKEIFKTIFSVENKIYGIAYCFCLLLPGFIMLMLFNNERYVYYWDYSGYWIRAINFTQNFFDNPGKELNYIYHSINISEYNTFPNLLISPINKFLGVSFNLYIFSNFLVYYLPFSLITSNILIKTSPGMSNRLKLALPFFILFFTPCLIPMRFGMVDVIGLMFIAISLSIFINTNYLRQVTVKQSVILGIVLLLLIFSRRWYAFWFEAFFVSAFITNLIYGYRHKDRKVAINSTVNLAIAGAVAMAIMLIFFMPFFKMTVLKDYKDIYAAWRTAGAFHQVKIVTMFFSGFIILTALAGTILSFKKEKSLTTFMAISILIITLHFTRVNDFACYHHFYLLAPFFVIFFCKGLLYLDKSKYVLPAFFVLLLTNSYFTFAVNNDDSTNAYIFTGTNAKPANRPDYNTLMSLSDKATQLLAEGNNIYCLASGTSPGGVFNDEILKNARLPYPPQTTGRIIFTQHVDKRDHFPNELFLANYVIVTTPVQLHLGAENQKLIDYFNREILEGSMKGHFEKVQEFMLDKGVKVILMKKTAGFSDVEMQVMKDYFKNAYPEYPDMYNVDKTMPKITELTMGDGVAAINFLEGNKIEFIPGSGRASRMTLQFGPNDSTLSFNAIFRDKESLVHNCDPEKDGEVYLTILENDVEVKKLYITHKQDVPVSIDVSGNKKITLIVDKGKNEDYCDWFELTDFIIK